MSNTDTPNGDAVPSFQDWNAKIIEEFRANEGVVGGQFKGAPILLLHTTGAKSSLERINPMMYLNLDERIYVFASKAGADTDPDWFRNLVATPRVSVERATEIYEATAKVVAEPERQQIYAVQARRYPGFAEYQTKTSRVIPVVELSRS